MQDYDELALGVSTGVAVRGVPLARGHGTVDYLLFANRMAIGAVEAKPVGTPLTGVETQTSRYGDGIPKDSSDGTGERVARAHLCRTCNPEV